MSYCSISAAQSVSELAATISGKEHMCLAKTTKDEAAVYCQLEGSVQTFTVSSIWIATHFRVLNVNQYISGGYKPNGKPILVTYRPLVM